MKQKITAYILVCVILCTILAGCTADDRADQFLGKTSAEIIAEYGAFDCTMMPPDEDGLYRSCRCGYTVREPRVGFLGASPEVLFFISFDENGIAYACAEDYRPGG